jgi:hypothetical protein
VLERDFAVDQDRAVAAAALDVARGAAGEVVDHLGLQLADLGQVEHGDVGALAGREHAAVGQAQHPGRPGGQPAHAFGEAEQPALTHPVGQDERRPVAVHDL